MVRKITKKKKKEEDKKEEVNEDVVLEVPHKQDEGKIRITGIHGDINEERVNEAIYGILALKEMGKITIPDEKDPEKFFEFYNPIDFYISTAGGSACEMFALYDVMRGVREFCPIHTYGLGKVMSAGVLLLAAGTKGQRKIGKYCRVMLHGVISGQHGYLQDVENEFEEAKITQRMYVQALAEETDMTQKYLKKLIDKKTNVYLNAEEAVRLGIADEVV
jgi:ATP-dependent Clp endopeptidase proteolytic subunit ClpP